MEYTRDDWQLEWIETGEGYSEDYNPDDPDDRPLLRADLSYQGIPCRDGSYCTLAPADTDEALLEQMSNDLFSVLQTPRYHDIPRDASGNPDPDGEVSFNRRAMEEWTWRTDPAKLTPSKVV